MSNNRPYEIDNTMREMSTYLGIVPEYGFNSYPMFTCHYNLIDRCCNIRNKTLVEKEKSNEKKKGNGKWWWKTKGRSSYNLTKTTSSVSVDSVDSVDSEEDRTSVNSL